MTIAHYAMRIFLLVHPSRAESKQQAIERLQCLVSHSNAMVNGLQRLIGGWCREVAMMHRAMPIIGMLKQIGWCINFSRKHLLQSLRNGEGIVQYAIGVYIASKLGALQSFAHLGGKARAYQHQLVAMRQGG